MCMCMRHVHTTHPPTIQTGPTLPPAVVAAAHVNGVARDRCLGSKQSVHGSMDEACGALMQVLHEPYVAWGVAAAALATVAVMVWRR